MKRTRLGFTLIELLVAVSVGIILLGGLIQIFIMTRNNYRVQQGLNYMQENLRFAVGELGYSARMAGFFWTIGLPEARQAASAADVFSSATGAGAVKSPNELTVMPGTPAPPCGLSSWAVGIQGFNAVSTGVAPPCVVPTNYLRGTDAMLVTYLRPVFMGLPAITTPAAAAGSAVDLVAPASPLIADAGLYAIIFDKERSGEANATQGGLIGKGSELRPLAPGALLYSDGSDLGFNGGAAAGSAASVKRGAAMMPLQVEVYYLRPCAVLDNALLCAPDADGGYPQPTLVRRSLGEDGGFRDEAIVSGIEQFQVEYLASGCGGYLNAADINLWAGCDGVFTAEQRWQRVISTRISLLARSNERNLEIDDALYDLSADTPAYRADSATQLTSNERHRRRTHVSFSQVRNGVRPLPPLPPVIP
jgi:type IV pilus assembly protein PilW